MSSLLQHDKFAKRLLKRIEKARLESVDKEHVEELDSDSLEIPAVFARAKSDASVFASVGLEQIFESGLLAEMEPPHPVTARKVGLADPSDKHSAKPLKQHADDFEAYLRGKENSDSHCTQTASYSRFVIRKCKFRKISDISASKVQKCIAGLRRNELSISTCNHYLRAIKGFTRWLVRDRRTKEDRLVHMTLMNEDTDRRHDRRALSAEEFTRLIEVAKDGPPIETICGQDRIIMYVLSAWTGFRKREIGSLVVCLARDWLATKPQEPSMSFELRSVIKSNSSLDPFRRPEHRRWAIESTGRSSLNLSTYRDVKNSR